jgi:hypothetical protein
VLAFARFGEKNQPMPRSNPLDRFNCGPVKFSGGNDALSERHLSFGHVVPSVRQGYLARRTVPGEMNPTRRETHPERKRQWLRSQFMVSVASAAR